MTWPGPHPRRFRLYRDADITGVSGDGHVVDGIQFIDGRVALRWRRPPNSISIYDSITDVETIHGHDGATRVEFLDPPACMKEICAEGARQLDAHVREMWDGE